MLAKKYRLPVQSFFAERSKTIKNSFFILRLKENNLSFNRFGVLASKKISKKAARRNTLKRMVFNFIKANKLHEAGSGQKGLDALISLLPGAEGASKEGFLDCLSQVLGKIQKNK